MADNGGVKLAFKAYREYMNRHPLQKKLPGLQNLTHDQMFYIAFAKVRSLMSLVKLAALFAMDAVLLLTYQ